jgi:hypothetical protein
MTNKDIIQELSELGSQLAGGMTHNIYSVPEGYFEGFADRTLNLIRTNESLAWLSTLPKTTPYEVPAGYFDALDRKVMEAIRNHPDYLNSAEELDSISPLLSSLTKRPVYSVPQGYFENFNVAKEQNRSNAKVVSIAKRSWFRYAAAAVIISAIAVTGLFIYNNNQRNSAGKTLARFEKEVKKIDDVRKTDSLIDFMDAGLNEKELASNHNTAKIDDVQRLLQDVPTDELKEFNEQTKDIESLMMTN